MISLKIRLRRIGNSKGIIIPQPFLKENEMDLDNFINLFSGSGFIKLTKIEKREGNKVIVDV